MPRREQENPLTAITGSPNAASLLNLIARFLAHEQVTDLASHPGVDCIIICASSVLHQACKLFTILQARPDLTKTLVLCGGIGHSTSLIYDAVANTTWCDRHADAVIGLPEARVLEKLLEEEFELDGRIGQDSRVLVEDKSTNCGENAAYSRRVLEAAGVPTPKTCIVIQDPTMARRTIASFEKTYADCANPPEFLSCPFLVPKLLPTDWASYEAVVYHDDVLDGDMLWEPERFIELVMGEIPRLRDDHAGYGPKGKGFITHVDIPEEVEDAWQRLRSATSITR